jgi:cysteine desulfurase
MTPLYLDHNATTPLDPRVFEAMTPYFLENFGNASSVEHRYGSVANSAIEKAREQVAVAIGAIADEITFTGSCTEANNIAILGVSRSLGRPGHFITSTIEHPSVTETTRQLEHEGHKVTRIGVDEFGRIKLDLLEQAITSDTALVSIIAGNNEVGTIQDMEAIADLCRARNVLLHMDMAQMLAYEAFDMRKLPIDMLSLSAHKAYGPKGIGALYVRRRRPRIKVSPLIFGGGQEKGLRSGTLNTPMIVGFGEAAAIASKDRNKTRKHVIACADIIRESMMSQINGIQLNGHPTHRLPSNLSFSISGIEPLALMRVLRDTICFSASSACATTEIKTSPVLLAMFGEVPRAREAFRISCGKYTTLDQAKYASQMLVESVATLRNF